MSAPESPDPWLTATSLGVLAIAVLLPLTPAGSYVGLVALPWRYYAMLGVLVLVYLLIVELVKQCFYRWSTFDAGASAAPTDGGRRTMTGTGE